MHAPFLCVGAAHWDLIGRTAAPLPPGADVPGRVTRQPGGVAANVARALVRLGQPVQLVAAVGRDAEGAALAAVLAAEGVGTEWFWRHDGRTDAYLAIEGAGGALRAAVADCGGLERAGAALVAPLLAGGWRGTIVADGNLAPEVLAEVCGLGAPVAFVPASPRKLAGARMPGGLALYLNRGEAAALCERRFADTRSAAAALLDRGAASVLVTDGAAEATAGDAAGLVGLAPPPVVVRSVTGAGDVLVAAHLAARACGLGAEPALAAALAAAAEHIAQEVP